MCRRPFRHKARPPQVRTHTFIAQPPHLRHFALVTRASRIEARSPCLAAPSMQFLSIGSRFTLHASFPHSVALMQLRFTSLTVTSSWRDLHPQVCAHAGRTSHRARHAVPLRLTPSFLTLHFSSWATTRVVPTPSFLPPRPGHGTPCPYDLTPTTSFLTPHSSLLTPHSSLLTPHSSLLTPHSSFLNPHSSTGLWQRPVPVTRVAIGNRRFGGKAAWLGTRGCRGAPVASANRGHMAAAARWFCPGRR